MQAIETEYKGYRFRSRLEARWAVFFDKMRINYEYESEGYTLENGKSYLPDFYLPDQNAFVEIKSVGAIKLKIADDGVVFENGRENANKYKQFVDEAVTDGFNVLILEGDPYDAFAWGHGGNGMAHLFLKGICGHKLNALLNDDDEVHPCDKEEKCITCERAHAAMYRNPVGFTRTTIVYADDLSSGQFPEMDNLKHISMFDTSEDELSWVGDEDAREEFMKMHEAIMTAREARFEHGEKGAR